MTPDGIEANLDELAAMQIKSSSKNTAAHIIAEKIVEKYGEDFIKEVMDGITVEEVRDRVLYKITDDIVENWRQNG